MPKPKLQEPLHTLEGQIIATFIAGCKEYRPDLDYPASYSDMQAGARALLRRFDMKMRPVDIALPFTDE